MGFIPTLYAALILKVTINIIETSLGCYDSIMFNTWQYLFVNLQLILIPEVKRNSALGFLLRNLVCVFTKSQPGNFPKIARNRQLTMMFVAVVVGVVLFLSQHELLYNECNNYCVRAKQVAGIFFFTEGRQKTRCLSQWVEVRTTSALSTGVQPFTACCCSVNQLSM